MKSSNASSGRRIDGNISEPDQREFSGNIGGLQMTASSKIRSRTVLNRINETRRNITVEKCDLLFNEKTLTGIHTFILRALFGDWDCDFQPHWHPTFLSFTFLLTSTTERLVDKQCSVLFSKSRKHVPRKSFKFDFIWELFYRLLQNFSKHPVPRGIFTPLEQGLVQTSSELMGLISFRNFSNRKLFFRFHLAI